MSHCLICGISTNNDLCSKHSEKYVWDSSVKSFRLKKRNAGSRYTQEVFHRTEIRLTKILEDFYSPKKIITSVHPIWAKTPKGVLFEYDIMIKGKRVFVEYNGAQHYKFTKFFHKKKSNFKAQRKRDFKKRVLAELAGYNLLIFDHKEPIFPDYVIQKVETFLEEHNVGAVS